MTGTERVAEVMQSTRIHRESASHALSVGDVEHWCLKALVDVDVPRLLAAVDEVLKLTGATSEPISPAQIRRALSHGLAGTPLPVRGICPVCGRDVGLRRSGTLKHHYPTPRRPQPNCQGSLQVPKGLLGEEGGDDT